MIILKIMMMIKLIVVIINAAEMLEKVGNYLTPCQYDIHNMIIIIKISIIEGIIVFNKRDRNVGESRQ